MMMLQQVLEQSMKGVNSERCLIESGFELCK